MANEIDEIDRLKIVCRLAADQAAEQGKHFQEQGASLLRWSATTCMTLNAGALVATLNVDKFDRSSQIWAGGWFLSGACISVVMAGLLAISFNRTGTSFRHYAHVLRKFEELGDPALHEELQSEQPKHAGAMGGFAIFCFLLTLIAFVVGCGILIEGAN